MTSKLTKEYTNKSRPYQRYYKRSRHADDDGDGGADVDAGVSEGCWEKFDGLDPHDEPAHVAGGLGHDGQGHHRGAGPREGDKNQNSQHEDCKQNIGLQSTATWDLDWVGKHHKRNESKVVKLD